MPKATWVLVALISLFPFLPGCRTNVATPTQALPELALQPDDRILILAPHPDDESLACGGLIQRALAMKLPVRLVWLTDGDNNEWSFILYRKRLVMEPSAIRAMGEVRHNEAVAAAKALGLPGEQLSFLGYPDFGTLHIWYSHWADEPPFKSMLTRVTAVPYADSFRPGAPYKGDDIVRDITSILREFRPTKVFCSHPSDLNVDHQALYLFTRIALWDVAKEMQPTLHPFLVHAVKWPQPVGLHPAETLPPPSQLAAALPWATSPLTKPEQQAKETALQAHRSQMGYSQGFMLSMVRANELFSDFPPVTLAGLAPAETHGTGHFKRAPELQDELTETERAKFVGIEEVRYWREGDDLLASIHFSRPLAGEVSASVSVFGYRTDRPFAQMPKLRVVFGELEHAVFDQERKLPAGTVQFQRQAHQLTVRIPLTALGDPHHALASVHTSLGIDSLDWAEWRVIECTR